MLAFIFRDCPPPHLLQLRLWGVAVVSLSDCPGVLKIEDVEGYVKDRFVVVVGDRRLAKKYDAAYCAEREVEQFLRWLMRESPPPALRPYLN